MKSLNQVRKCCFPTFHLKSVFTTCYRPKRILIPGESRANLIPPLSLRNNPVKPTSTIDYRHFTCDFLSYGEVKRFKTSCNPSARLNYWFINENRSSGSACAAGLLSVTDCAFVCFMFICVCNRYSHPTLRHSINTNLWHQLNIPRPSAAHSRVLMAGLNLCPVK